MEKERRQQTILNLIRARRIGTQQELAGQLERAGIPATQSSISRDLVELGVVKHHGHYAVPRATNGAAARGLLGMDVAGDNLVVAKCVPGLASAVAVEIDRAGDSRRSSARSPARTRSSSPSPTARRSARRSKKSGSCSGNRGLSLEA